MDANRLREIEVRLKKATPGEWFNKDDADGNSHYTIQSQDGSWIGYAGQRINAVLIAHAPKDLQDLLAYVEALRKVREEERARSRKYREALRQMIGTHGEPCMSMQKGDGPCEALKFAKEALTEGGEG